MEEKTLFNIWLSFLFLGLVFNIVYYFQHLSPPINIAYWFTPFVLLIIFQGQANRADKSSRYSLLIYPFVFLWSVFLLDQTIAPHIHFSLNDTLYCLENKKTHLLLNSYIDNFTGRNNAIIVSSVLNISFLCSLLFFSIFYVIAMPISTLRRAYNGLYTILGIILLFHAFMPTISMFKGYAVISQLTEINKALILKTHIKELSFISIESAVALYMGLTMLRTNKTLGTCYMIFTIFLIVAMLYLKVGTITDITIGLIISTFVFFKISKGFSQNKSKFTM